MESSRPLIEHHLFYFSKKNERRIYFRTHSNKNTWMFLLLFLCSVPNVFVLAQTNRASFRFYSEEIIIPEGLDWAMKLNALKSFEISEIKSKISQIPEKELAPVINSISDQLSKTGWNDLLILRCIIQAIKNRNPKIDRNIERLVSFVSLKLMGFSSLLVIQNGALEVYVESAANQDGPCKIAFGDASYFKIGGPVDDCSETVSLIENYVGEKNDFQLTLSRYPDFSKHKNQTFLRKFLFKGKTYSIKYELDQNRIELLSDYPIMGNVAYIELPISEFTLKQISSALFNEAPPRVGNIEDAELLLAFVRKSFDYQDDLTNNGIPHYSFSADQTLYFESSDCEDRVALFFQLQKDLIGYPMIVLATEDHLTIGLMTSIPDPNAIEYNGQFYSIADPSWEEEGPIIGKWPAVLNDQPYKVIYSWEPRK